MSQARIQVVIFDVGGVLVRTEDWTPRQQWEERLGLEPNSLEPIVHNSPIGRAAQQGQVTNREYWTVLGDRLRLDPASRSVFESDFYA